MKNKEFLTSIIILSYNGLEYTQLCLQSIRKNTKPGTYEIIVVDNGSTDGSADWLARQTDIRCIFNKKNVGFPKGCNQGLKIAKGTDLLLLNNDTIVTPHWLDNMLIALHSRANVGAVGCVTNHCSNEQSVSLSYNSIEELMVQAEHFNKSDSTKWYPWMMLVGYCLLFKREVYLCLGGLDEAFSPGNFEDDDYCIRMRKAGYELLLCEDTYIHHFGSVSFTGKNDIVQQRAKKERYNKLLEKNGKYFRQKWSIKGEYRAHYRMFDFIYDELKGAKNILLVNCEFGYDLYWLNRKMDKVSLCGLTKDELGESLTGRTFPLYVCDDFIEGLEKYYAKEKFARIALLGNYQERKNADELINVLRQHLTRDGILFFGDKDHIYRMQNANPN